MRKLSLKELNRVDVDTFKKQEKSPIVVVLDNVRSALNVGSAFRTSDAFAASHLYLCGITAQPPHREILKTAIGATESVNWTYFKTTKEAIYDLKNKEYKIIGVEQTDQSILLQEFKVQTGSQYAFVFGNEVNGLSNDILDELDACIEIPQFGTKHSLNISVSLGIIIWDIFKQFKYD